MFNENLPNSLLIVKSVSLCTQTGLPPEKKEFFKNAKTEITYSNNGDQWTINVGMQGVPNTRTFQFKLGEEYKSESLDGSPLKVDNFHGFFLFFSSDVVFLKALELFMATLLTYFFLFRVN